MPKRISYSTMRSLSIIALAFIADLVAIAPVNASELPPSYALDHRIVLFGAQWCAPCRVELRHIASLARAAAPKTILLAWVDEPPSEDDVSQKVEVLDADTARKLANQVLGEGYGLPSAVLYDRGGKPCAIWRAPLMPQDIASLEANCPA